jgi:hypothetical protein
MVVVVDLAVGVADNVLAAVGSAKQGEIYET